MKKEQTLNRQTSMYIIDWLNQSRSIAYNNNKIKIGQFKIETHWSSNTKWWLNYNSIGKKKKKLNERLRTFPCIINRMVSVTEGVDTPKAPSPPVMALAWLSSDLIVVDCVWSTFMVAASSVPIVDDIDVVVVVVVVVDDILAAVHPDEC